MVDTADNDHNIFVQSVDFGSKLEVDMPSGSKRGMEEVYKNMLAEEIATFFNQDILQ